MRLLKILNCSREYAMKFYYLIYSGGIGGILSIIVFST